MKSILIFSWSNYFFSWFIILLLIVFTSLKAEDCQFEQNSLQIHKLSILMKKILLKLRLISFTIIYNSEHIPAVL